ncbi:MAG: indolepyruvate ferredoxin oxidoreductase subunit beta [Candidatus Verstraetearchaeota archaeon]|nr:indolepyruvate ferredoxin oxidoreductase subunit beta [Candidatus Verstraetearchaeota archaeon]
MSSVRAMSVEVVISGVGGQGNVKAAQILGAAAVKAGLRVRVSDVFGIAQRGGPVMSHVRIGEVYGSMVSAHSADAVVGMEPMEALRAASAYLKPGGIAIVNTRPVFPVEVNIGKAVYPPIDTILGSIKTAAGRVITVDATEIASLAGIPLAANVVMLGVLAGTGVLPFAPEYIIESIKENIPRSIRENLDAFERGFAIGKQ